MLCAVLLACPAWGAARTESGAFRISDGRAFVQERHVLVTADLSHQLSEAALEALQNGVGLEVIAEAELVRERILWWDEILSIATRRLLLEYHALANQYVLRDLLLDTSQTFRSLPPMLDELNAVRDLRVGADSLLAKGQTYRVRLRTRLDIESLPAPLRPMAYVSDAWQLSSGWRSWALEWPK
jgi:hypothetical protein